MRSYRFIAEVTFKEIELMIKSLSKFVASFDYFDKSLTVLSKTSGGESIELFVTVIGSLVGIEIASFSLAFSVSTRFIKKTCQEETQNIKKKHNKIFMLARNKLNSIEIKLSEGLTNDEVCHEDFMEII